MSTSEIDFLADLDRACEAAARGDYRDAERWTGLAERKLSMVRRACEVAIKAGWKPDLLEFLQAGQTRAPDTAPAESDANGTDPRDVQGQATQSPGE